MSSQLVIPNYNLYSFTQHNSKQEQINGNPTCPSQQPTLLCSRFFATTVTVPTSLRSAQNMRRLNLKSPQQTPNTIKNCQCLIMIWLKWAPLFFAVFPSCGTSLIGCTHCCMLMHDFVLMYSIHHAHKILCTRMQFHKNKGA